MARAFIIRPFGTKSDSSGQTIDFDRVDRELVSPALRKAGLGGGTTGEIIDAGNIREDMFALILEADLVVCDITIHNANVFYELGIRHALRKKRTVMIKGQPTGDGTPFDLLTDRYLAYEIDQPAAALEKLVDMITASLRSDRPTDSPIFQMLPSLDEADPAKVLQVVPLDFREEVERARAARLKGRGWLRLLSEEVRTRRFRWEGLKLVADAQWGLTDYEGARRSWEEIRENQPDDVAANLALANIYERLYRRQRQPEILEASDQAIERVLGKATRKQRAEALALMGRNQKTRWRLDIPNQGTLEELREAAMNRALKRSYEAYRDAYYEDLNHYYPGLAALQMGTILLDLAGEGVWYEAFDSDLEADRYREKLQDEVSALQTLVPTAVAVALRRLSPADPETVWARISEADSLFLSSEQRERRVVSRYRDVIPHDNPFAWDAARGQLELFADLGIRAQLARSVIEEMDTRIGRFGVMQSSAQSKPVHLVLFAGHRVDGPERSEPRFPAAGVGRAEQLIRRSIEEILDDAHEFISLASAAPGADILWHEACGERGIASTICLPMPADAYATSVFEHLDDWRTRFLDLMSDHETLVLSERAGLPRWLADSGTDPWERGNLWVMKMAQSWGAARVTLVALWDGKERGDERGGTAHMVELAREAGTVYIRTIDAAELLAREDPQTG